MISNYFVWRNALANPVTWPTMGIFWARLNGVTPKTAPIQTYG